MLGIRTPRKVKGICKALDGAFDLHRMQRTWVGSYLLIFATTNNSLCMYIILFV
jgi:hypothetical protein